VYQHGISFSAVAGRRAVFYAGPFQIGHGLWHMRVADAGYKLLQLEGR
jgi:hypothetical protein